MTKEKKIKDQEELKTNTQRVRAKEEPQRNYLMWRLSDSGGGRSRA